MQTEDEGNYLKAFSLYLKDSTECIKQNSLVRAALSCSCAAECLVLVGNLAASRQLYLQTAILYEKNADHVIAYSIREALWSYQEAYEYYNIAGETNKAHNIYEIYVSLSRKVNPFSNEKEAMDLLRQRKLETESKSSIHQTNMEVSADIDRAIKNFQEGITLKSNKREESVTKRVFNKISKERSKSEKGIND